MQKLWRDIDVPPLQILAGPVPRPPQDRHPCRRGSQALRYGTTNILLAYLVVFAADDWKAAIEGNYLR